MLQMQNWEQMLEVMGMNKTMKQAKSMVKNTFFGNEHLRAGYYK